MRTATWVKLGILLLLVLAILQRAGVGGPEGEPTSVQAPPDMEMPSAADAYQEACEDISTAADCDPPASLP